ISAKYAPIGRVARKMITGWCFVSPNGLFCDTSPSDLPCGEHSQSAVSKTHLTYHRLSVAKLVSFRNKKRSSFTAQARLTKTKSSTGMDQGVSKNEANRVTNKPQSSGVDLISACG